MGIRNTFKNIISDTTGLIGEGYSDASNLLKDTLSKFYDVKNITVEKLGSLANELIALSPIIEKTGFRTKEINVGVSLPPKVVFHFEKIADVSKADIKTVLDENADKTLLKVIVNTLLSADEFQSKLNLTNFKFTEIDIEVGVPPQVNVKLVNTSK